MSYNTTRSFERQPTVLDYERALWKRQNEIKLHIERVKTRDDLIECLKQELYYERGGENV